MGQQVTAIAIDLPEELALPLETGAPHWYWIGGSPAVDFANTLRERWRRRVECLVSPDDLERWTVLAGLHDGSGAATAAQLASARVLREHIDRALVAVEAGRPPDGSDLRAIDRRLARSAPRPRLLADAGGTLAEHGPVDPIERALGLLALDAARIVGTNIRERVRVCAAPDCSARFLDRSPSGRRRWCSMAACGNRAKARRHRRRSTAGGRRAGRSR